MDFLFHRPFARTPTTMHTNLLDADDTLNAKCPAQLASETIGPLFVGFTVCAALFGVTCAQGFVYFRRHSQDHARLKSFVIALLFLIIVHIVLVTHAIYVYTVINRGNFRHDNAIVWSMVIQILPSTLIMVIVQYVWLMRIKTLSQNYRTTQIVVGMLLSVFIEAAMSIVWMSVACTAPRWGEVEDVHLPVGLCFFLRTFNDISVTAMLCYHLQRSKNGLRKTDSIIQTMMGNGLRVGLINCMCSVALMILLAIVPSRLYYVSVYIISAGLYANSLLVMLNWRSPQQSSERVSVKLETIQLSTAYLNLSYGGPRDPVLAAGNIDINAVET